MIFWRKVDFQNSITVYFSQLYSNQIKRDIGGKTGKIAVLPSFCKIEHVDGMTLSKGGLSLPRRACRAGGTPANKG